MMNLGSEGVYLDEKCGTNASRHIPAFKTPVKNTKNTDFRVTREPSGLGLSIEEP